DGPESRLVRWLDAEGIGAEYCSNVDLHTTPALLTAYDCLIIVWHDEYWSKPMRDQVERFVAGGGNLIVLSGNTCYRAIRLERGNRMVVFHKYASSDPVRDAETTTVAWAEPPVNRPQNRFLGVGFTDGAYGGSAAPFTVRFPSHWLFAGVAATTTVPFMGYEADAAAYVFETEGYPRVTGDEGTPLTFTVLADADLSHWTGKPGRVTMGLYSKHGTVFNVATTDWLQNLSDPVIAQITRNALRRLGSRLPRDWELIGHARNGVALASTDGRLYLASSANRLWRRFPIRADVPWRDVGHANHVVAMAGLGGTLYCVTADNRLWSRAAGDADVDWTPIRFGPPSGTRALAATGGFLYAVDPAGRLSRRPASATGMADSGDSWRPVTGFGADATVCALTAYGDILIAATSDNRLLRSNRDFIAESTAWHRIHHCNGATGLAVVEWMLYVITSSHAIWQMDLYGLSEP
ncbi:MAG: N,N-dimethylformamidase beta subunit family domain-containing protein, partial [Vicinamibacterales bacterium]